jgi:phosphoribosylanthranilate isomerase
MDAASGFLLDAHQAGSGQPWDWRSAPSTPAHLPRILAGGLTPANVASAIDATEPWAVDVSSGVERSRGIKDHNLVAEFIQAVRACDLAAGRDAEPLPPGFSGLA